MRKGEREKQEVEGEAGWAEGQRQLGTARQARAAAEGRREAAEAALEKEDGEVGRAARVEELEAMHRAGQAAQQASDEMAWREADAAADEAEDALRRGAQGRQQGQLAVLDGVAGRTAEGREVGRDGVERARAAGKAEHEAAREALFAAEGAAAAPAEGLQRRLACEEVALARLALVQVLLRPPAADAPAAHSRSTNPVAAQPDRPAPVYRHPTHPRQPGLQRQRWQRGIGQGRGGVLVPRVALVLACLDQAGPGQSWLCMSIASGAEEMRNTATTAVEKASPAALAARATATRSSTPSSPSFESCSLQGQGLRAGELSLLACVA